MLLKQNALDTYTYIQKHLQGMTKETQDKLNFINDAIDEIVQNPKMRASLKQSFKSKLSQLRGGKEQDLLDQTIHKLLFSIFMNDKKSHSDDEINNAVQSIEKPEVQGILQQSLAQQRAID